MRYHLRTLHILLAVLPPALAVGWWIVASDPTGVMAAFAASIFFGLTAFLFLGFVGKILEFASTHNR
jgi:hypothetical protein